MYIYLEPFSFKYVFDGAAHLHHERHEIDAALATAATFCRAHHSGHVVHSLVVWAFLHHSGTAPRTVLHSHPLLARLIGRVAASMYLAYAGLAIVPLFMRPALE